jgi:hypothetical protein
MDVNHDPPAVGTAVTAMAGAITVVSLGAVSASGGALGALGVFVALFGVVRPDRRVLGGGVTVAGLGLLLTGVAGAPPEPLLAGAIGVVLLWDFGEHAIGLGEQLTADTDATRNVAVHAAASVAVGAVVVGFGFGIYSVAAGGQPLVALFFLLAGAVGLAVALR